LKHKEKAMVTSYRHLLRCNTTEEDNDALPLFSSSQTQRRKNTQENNKRKPRERKEFTFKLPFYPLFQLPLLPSCFCLLAFVLPFQVLSFGSLFYPPISSSLKL
jgi:lipopolysaccharide export LptBFGC system permease protein LptF